MRLRPQLSCVLFDLDGTLVDTVPDLGDAANVVRADAGLPPLPIADYRPVASAGARGLLRVALGLTPEAPGFEPARKRFLETYRDNIARGSGLFAGMDDSLRAFERAGLRWGVITNKPQWLTDPLMEQLALAGRSACTIGTREGLAAKPAPDGLLLACRELGVTPAECVYVGDDRRDIDAARAAAMPSAAAGWGYLGEDGDIASWQADEILNEPRDMLRWCP